MYTDIYTDRESESQRESIEIGCTTPAYYTQAQTRMLTKMYICTRSSTWTCSTRSPRYRTYATRILCYFWGLAFYAPPKMIPLSLCGSRSGAFEDVYVCRCAFQMHVFIHAHIHLVGGMHMLCITQHVHLILCICSLRIFHVLVLQECMCCHYISHIWILHFYIDTHIYM